MPRTQEEDQLLAFLKMAAIELRRIAERVPEVTTELSRVATQIEAEALAMEKRSG
jgi:hypothetical protein